MRFIDINECKPGMIVAEDVFLQSDIILIRRGSAIKKEHINLLLRFQCLGVYVDDAISEGIITETVVNPATHQNARGIMRDMFTRASYDKADNETFFKSIIDTIETMISQMYDSDERVHNLSLLKDYDDYTYQHSVDVGILSLMIGKALELPRNQLFDLGKAAFFHDIGKMFIPKDILQKPDRLTLEEFTIMKSHSTMGYNFLKEALNQPEDVCAGALYHHEKFDGTGYPMGISGNQIPLYPKIISIADIYDALNSKRVYKDALLASEGYEFVMANFGSHFDPEIARAFLRVIAPFPAGSLVQLSDGRKAIVVKNNPGFMTRPVIRIINDDASEGLILVDMAQDPLLTSVTIVRRI